jgi:hypothetical protein
LPRHAGLCLLKRCNGLVEVAARAYVAELACCPDDVNVAARCAAHLQLMLLLLVQELQTSSLKLVI